MTRETVVCWVLSLAFLLLPVGCERAKAPQGDSPQITAGRPTTSKDEVFEAVDSSLVEVRVYADRGARLPDGSKGGAVQVYGVRLGKDGAETVLWRRFLWEFDGLKFAHNYSYLALDQEQVYLYLQVLREKGFVVLNRKTGEVIRQAGEDDEEYKRLRREHRWITLKIVNRPQIGEHGTQTLIIPRTSGPLRLVTPGE